MQWRKRPATHITTLVEEDSASLTVGRRLEQEIFDFIERNSGIREDGRPGSGHTIDRLGRIGKRR
jgi:hypothetical protein